MEDNFASMVAQITRLMRRNFDETGRLVGLTRPQWRLLAIVARYPGIHQGGIADQLEVEPVSVGRMLDRMQDSGLVERKPDPADRRAWRLFLTRKGELLLEQMRPSAGATIELALSGLDDADRDKLTSMLSLVRGNLLRQQTAGVAEGAGDRADG